MHKVKSNILCVSLCLSAFVVQKLICQKVSAKSAIFTSANPAYRQAGLGEKFMLEKTYNWYKIAEHTNELDFAENNIAVTELDGRKICVAKFKDQLFAFAYSCPHAGGFLAEGHIDAMGNVVCPIHRYRYNIENGRNTSGEGFYLRHWAVEIREDGVYVGLKFEV